MHRFLVVIEKADGNSQPTRPTRWGASLPATHADGLLEDESPFQNQGL